MRRAALALVVVLAACGPKQGEGPPVGVSTNDGTATLSDKPTVYAFDSLDEDRPINSDVLKGRVVVLAFITTGSFEAQAQANYLNAMAKNDGDKTFYGLLALHPRKEIVLVETYRSSIGLKIPIALADGGATSAAGPFGEIPAVPTVVVLDRFGKLVWKHTGLAKADEIRAQIRNL